MGKNTKKGQAQVADQVENQEVMNQVETPETADVQNPANENPASAEQAEVAPAENPAPAQAEKPGKMSDEELEALLEECKKNVGKKCQAVPFGTIEWKPGHIHGAFIEKRARKVLYDIRLDDGKSIKKMHDNNLLKISEEMADVTIKARGEKSAPKGLWDDEEEIQAEVEKWAHAVGKTIELESGEVGRITGLVPEKRAHTILLRAVVPTIDGDKTVHKTAKPGLLISEGYDEEGQAMQDKYQERRAKAPRKVLTPEEKIAKLEKEIEDMAVKLSEKRMKLAELKKALEKPEEPAVEDINDLI